MASIVNGPNGRKRIMFLGGDGTRKHFSLGKASKFAGVVKEHVEQLLAASGANVSPPTATVKWLSKIDDDLHARIAGVGLVSDRESQNLGPWLEKYLAGRNDLKPESYRKMEQTTAKLLSHFGEATALRSLTTDRAADWRQWLAKSGLSVAAIKTHCGNAKTIFAEAERRELVEESPFRNLASGSTAASNDRYITPDEAERIMVKLPDAQWRLLFALGRLAGLRIPSESHLLTWADVDKERGRLNVRSPKTEHHAGHERRSVPITPRLMELLNEAFGDGKAPEAALVSMRGSGNVRRVLDAAIAAAGVAPWPRLFQACRASCEQEWAMTYPQYAVSQWIGHSITVSGKHYANAVPDELFERIAGVRQRVQQPLESTGNATQTKNPAFTGFSVTSQPLATCRKSLQNKDLEAGGIEPPSRDCPNGSLYMLSRCFDLKAGGGHRQSPPASSRLCLTSGPTAELGGEPAFLRPT